VTECVRDPPVPVTVTSYVPVTVELVEVIIKVEVVDPPEVRVTVLGLTETVRPEGAVPDSETGPEKLLKLVNRRVELAEIAGLILRLEGLAEMEKSDTEGPITDTRVVREFVSFPL
jgi:hypothetical protein